MKSPFLALVSTLSIQALATMAALTVPVFAPAVAREIGTDPVLVGIYVALVYIGSMISGLVSGNFIHRYGAIRLSQIGLFLCALGLVMTTAGSLSVFAVSALILGFGYGPMTPASSHILAKTTPPRLMAFIFSLKQTGVPVGGALAGAVVPSLVLLAGWRVAALAVGALCLAAAFVTQPIRKGFDSDRRPGVSFSFQDAVRPLKMVVALPKLFRLSLVSLMFAGMQQSLIAYLVIYLTEDFRYSLVAAGLFLSAAQASGILGRIVWGAIADQSGRPGKLLGFLGVSMAVGAIATALFGQNWPHSVILLVCCLFGATAIGWNGVYLAQVARLAPPGEAGAATGGTLFFTFSGVVIGPPAFGAIASISGSYPVAFLVFAAGVLLCSFAFLGTRGAPASKDSLRH